MYPPLMCQKRLYVVSPAASGNVSTARFTSVFPDDSEGIVRVNPLVGLRESPRGIINGHNKVCVSTK